MRFNLLSLTWSTGLASAGLSLFLILPACAQTQPAPKPAQPSTIVPGPPANTTPTPATPSERSILQQMQDAFTGIAKNAEPFVVNIKAARSISMNADPDETPAQPTPPAPKTPTTPSVPGNPFPKQEEATGSGLVVRADGYILTNDHVVEGSAFVTVTLTDGEEFRGKVIPDFRSDLALVKIDPGKTTLTVAKFADSDQVQPGQWAVAIGSPFDLQNTMTVGVISAIHRHQTIGEDISSARYYPDLIQTDAAINPGNSGGPLLNLDGQVVGVNVAIESPVEGSAGVGFAIPANTAIYITEQLISRGRVLRGYLGLAPEDLTPARAAEYGVSSGAWVVQVDKDSPAGRAGIHATDIITRYDGSPVDGELSLRTAINATPPSKIVMVNLIRDGKPVTVNVTVTAPPPSETDNEPMVPAEPKIGISYRNLTASDREELSLSPDDLGAFVTAVAPNSPADEGGLLANDVIEQIGKKPTTSADDTTAALDAVKASGSATFVVLRSNGGKIQEIALDVKL